VIEAEASALSALPTEMISLEQARETVLSHVGVMPQVEVDLLDAAGRVAAQDLKSDIDIAPFGAVAMDGFGMRAAQLEGASEQTPVELKVVAEVAAGDFFEGQIGEGECIRIMTGACAPACIDTVVKYEIVKVVEGDGKTGSTVAFSEPAVVKTNIREPGEEAKAGETVVEAGEVINSAGVGFLAGCGVTRVPTYGRPKVAIIATGSELVDPTEVPTRGKIRNSNSYAIAACVREAGAEAHILPICKDTFEALETAVVDAVKDYDFVITTGGAAKGDYDFIAPVVEKLGDVYMTLINMRPGKAQTFGLVDGVPVFGLPGNPAAAYIGYQMLIRPALRKMQGYSHFELAHVRAKLASDIKAKKDPRMTLTRAVLTASEDGTRTIVPLKKQSSGLFGPLQRGNALLVVPHGDQSLSAGDEVECVLLDVPEETVL